MAQTEATGLLSLRKSRFQRVSASLHTEVLCERLQFYDVVLRDRFSSYLTSLQPLKHPNFLQLLTVQCGESGGVYWTETESEWPCSSLEEEFTSRLQKGQPWTEPEVRRLLRDLSAVLLFLHAKGFACHEVRPQDIIVSGDKFLLALPICSQTEDLIPPLLPVLSPERRQILMQKLLDLSETEFIREPAKSAVYSLAVITLWLIFPETWGIIQTPGQLFCSGSQVSSEGNTSEMLSKMLLIDPSERPTLREVLEMASALHIPAELDIATSLHSAFSSENWSDFRQNLISSWGKISAEVQYICQKCEKYVQISPTSSDSTVCSVHVLCGDCGSAQCPLCPSKRKLKVVHRSSTCRTCGSSFAFDASDSWRLRFLGSAFSESMKEICSAKCIPDSLQEQQEETKDYSQLQGDGLTSGFAAMRAGGQDIFLGTNWLTKPYEEKLRKAREVQQIWNISMSEDQVVMALDSIEEEKARKRRNNPELRRFCTRLITKHNGTMMCHFCARDICEHLEAVWTVCNGEKRAVCSMKCFQTHIPQDALMQLLDAQCPGCGGFIESRRLAETLTFEGIRDLPSHEFGFDCEFCFNPGTEQMYCGHLRCAACEGREDCVSCGKGTRDRFRLEGF